jgi:hypothetical protein
MQSRTSSRATPTRRDVTRRAGFECRADRPGTGRRTTSGWRAHPVRDRSRPTVYDQCRLHPPTSARAPCRLRRAGRGREDERVSDESGGQEGPIRRRASAASRGARIEQAAYALRARVLGAERRPAPGVARLGAGTEARAAGNRRCRRGHGQDDVHPEREGAARAADGSLAARFDPLNRPQRFLIARHADKARLAPAGSCPRAWMPRAAARHGPPGSATDARRATPSRGRAVGRPGRRGGRECRGRRDGPRAPCMPWRVSVTMIVTGFSPRPGYSGTVRPRPRAVGPHEPQCRRVPSTTPTSGRRRQRPSIRRQPAERRSAGPPAPATEPHRWRRETCAPAAPPLGRRLTTGLARGRTRKDVRSVIPRTLVRLARDVATRRPR